jgi:hypothetical protein
MESEREKELADVRAEIALTSQVVQALSTMRPAVSSDPKDEFRGDLLVQYEKLHGLLARQAALEKAAPSTAPEPVGDRAEVVGYLDSDTAEHAIFNWRALGHFATLEEALEARQVYLASNSIYRVTIVAERAASSAAKGDSG